MTGDARREAQETIKQYHYTHSVPSGKSYYFLCDGAIVVYSLPANKNIARYLLGREGSVWELSRLWAEDGHEKNLLTRVIACTLREFRLLEKVDAIVSYADVNVGHHGGVYRAASWIFTGQVEESRYYVNGDGVPVSRRKFHSGGRSMKKAEILALGYTELRKPGRFRYVRPLSKKVRREVLSRFAFTVNTGFGTKLYKMNKAFQVLPLSILS